MNLKHVWKFALHFLQLWRLSKFIHKRQWIPAPSSQKVNASRGYFILQKIMGLFNPMLSRYTVDPTSAAVLNVLSTYQYLKYSQIWDDELQHACLKAKNLKQTLLPFSSSVFI